MRYAGFWPRLAAVLIDFLVLLPFIAFSFWAFSASRAVTLAVEVPLAFLFAFYSIYFVGRWGQTLGKMALGIRVVALDGAKAGYRRALLRHGVDLAFSVVASVVTIRVLLSVSEAQYNALDLDGRLDLLTAKAGAVNEVLDWLQLAWIASELVVLLMNEKRRALHDYIAGTAVVHTS